jgi:hypothetical protein
MPLLLQLAATDIISGQGKEACAARLENGGFEAHTTTLFSLSSSGFVKSVFTKKTRGAFFSFFMIKALLSRDGACVDDASAF